MTSVAIFTAQLAGELEGKGALQKSRSLGLEASWERPFEHGEI